MLQLLYLHYCCKFIRMSTFYPLGFKWWNKKAIPALLSIIVFSTSFGRDFNSLDNSFSGKIIDANNGRPLPGATIYFSDLKTGSVSNAEGAFNIKNLPAGNHLVEISFVGYQSIVEQIFISGEVHKEYNLKPAIVENNTIVVTGFTSGVQIKRTPTPITVVKKEELFQSTATNIFDAISKQPGISQLSTGPAVSKPIIRGLGYNRILTYTLGTRQEGQQWGDEHGIEVDDYHVDKIEILKGPASLIYGSDGLAGVVNIISNTPIAQGKIRGNINSEYQANNGLYAFNGSFAGNLNGFNWNTYSTTKRAYDYKNKYDGYVFNSKFNTLNYGAAIGINKYWGFSHLAYTLFNQKVGLIEGDRDDPTGAFLKIVDRDANGEDVTSIATEEDFKSYQPFVPAQKIVHHKATWDNTFYLNNRSNIAVILGWQQNHRREFANVTAPNEPELYLKLNTYTYNIRYQLPSRSYWQTTVAINGMQQQNKNLGEEVLVPEYDLFDVGGVVYTKKNWPNLSVSGGLRYDLRNLNAELLQDNGTEKFAAFKRTFHNISASLGASYDISKQVTAKLNLSRGFRSPNIAELSANGVHEGSIRYEYGNLDLKSETSLQIDAGLEVATEHFSLKANLFSNTISNYIFLRKLVTSNGSDSIPAADNEEGYTAFKHFQTKAWLFGGELSLDLHPHPLDWLHFENTISFVRGLSDLDADSTRNLPSIPPLRWIPQLRADIKTVSKFLQNAFVIFEADVNAKQTSIFSAYNTETITPAYILVNTALGGNVRGKNKQTLFSIYLAANNLLDIGYQSHLSRLKYAPQNLVTGRTGVFNMGRNFNIKLSIPLEFTHK